MEEADTELSRLAQSQSYFGLLLWLIVVAVVSTVVMRWWRCGDSDDRGSGGVHVRIGHLNCARVTRRNVHLLFRNLTNIYEQRQGDSRISTWGNNATFYWLVSAQTRDQNLQDPRVQASARKGQFLDNSTNHTEVPDAGQPYLLQCPVLMVFSVHMQLPRPTCGGYSCSICIVTKGTKCQQTRTCCTVGTISSSVLVLCS